MKTTTMRRDTLQRPRNLEAILSWTKQVHTNWNKTALYYTTQMCIMCAFETVTKHLVHVQAYWLHFSPATVITK